MWKDDRNGNEDIYGYNLSTKEEFQITTNPKNQYCPEIYEDYVVWVDERNDPTDVYGYNLSTREEFQITANVLDQHRIAIYGDIVGYEGIGDYCNVYFYNLSTEEEFCIPADPGSFCGPATYCPGIYENIIVWKDERNDSGDIYGYNVLTSQEGAIRAPGLQAGPEIYGDVVVWTDYRNDNYDIYGFYLSDIDWYPFEPPPESPSFSESLKSVSEWFYGILVVVIVLIALLIWMRRREEEFPITEVEKESREHSSEKRN